MLSIIQDSTEFLAIENLFQKNFLQNEENSSTLEDDSSNNSISQILEQDSMSLNELVPIDPIFFKTPSRENHSISSLDSSNSNLFKNIEIDSNSKEEDEVGIFIGVKRAAIRRQRRFNKDNIRRKIKRSFLNKAFIKKLNDKLKEIKSKKYFRKFPSIFISDIDRKRNKQLFNMTLLEIFEKKELYINDKENGLENYLHNLKVVQSEEVKENEEFKKILNKTFSEFYEEYINSNEFKNEEIERLKKNNMEDDYIQRYIYLSKHLIEFFNQ